jgi:hypothetical protein
MFLDANSETRWAIRLRSKITTGIYSCWQKSQPFEYIVFLAGDRAAVINGAFIPGNGGTVQTSA